MKLASRLLFAALGAVLSSETKRALAKDQREPSGRTERKGWQVRDATIR